MPKTIPHFFYRKGEKVKKEREEQKKMILDYDTLLTLIKLDRCNYKLQKIYDQTAFSMLQKYPILGDLHAYC